MEHLPIQKQKDEMSATRLPGMDVQVPNSCIDVMLQHLLPSLIWDAYEPSHCKSTRFGSLSQRYKRDPYAFEGKENHAGYLAWDKSGRCIHVASGLNRLLSRIFWRNRG